MRACAWLPQATNEFPLREIPGTAVPSPLLTSKQVQAVWSRMLEARQSWLAVPLSQRAARLSALAAVLRTEGLADDAVLLARSTGLSVRHPLPRYNVRLYERVAYRCRAVMRTYESSSVLTTMAAGR